MNNPEWRWRMVPLQFLENGRLSPIHWTGLKSCRRAVRAGKATCDVTRTGESLTDLGYWNEKGLGVWSKFLKIGLYD